MAFLEEALELDGWPALSFRCEYEVCHGIDLHKQPFSELISEIKK